MPPKKKWKYSFTEKGKRINTKLELRVDLCIKKYYYTNIIFWQKNKNIFFYQANKNKFNNSKINEDIMLFISELIVIPHTASIIEY